MSRWSEHDLAILRSRGVKVKSEQVVAPAKVKFVIDEEHDYKADFEQQLQLVGVVVEREFYFARPRRFRSDWRVEDRKILIEYEGGLFKAEKSGHSSVAGIIRDIEKYNLAALLGYVVIRITPMHVKSGQALKWTEEAIAMKG